MVERTKRLFCALPLLAALVLIAPSVRGAAAEPPDEQLRSLAKLVADDVMLYAEVDVLRAVADFQQLDLVRLYQDEEVQDFLAPLIEQFGDELGQIQGGLSLLSMYGLPQILGGKIQIAVTPPAGEGQTDPGLLLLVRTNGPESFQASLARCVELLPKPPVDTLLERNGFSFVSSSLRLGSESDKPFQVLHGYVGDHFLLATTEQGWLETAGNLVGEGQSARALDALESFRAWQTTTARDDSVLAAYVAVPPILSQLDDHLRTESDRLGLSGIPAIGVSLGLASGRTRESLALILPPERTGVLGLLQAFQPGRPLTAPPSGSAAVWSMRVSPDLYLNRLRTFLERFDPPRHEELLRSIDRYSQSLGIDFEKDLLATIGNEYRVGAALPRGSFLPELFGSLALKDPERFRQALNQITEQWERTAPQIEREELLLDEHPGAFYLTIPGSPMSPALAVGADRLMLAGNPAALRKMVDAVANGSGSIRPHEDFNQTVALAVGEDTSSVCFLFYADLAASVEWALSSYESMLPVLLAQLPVKLDPVLMPLPDTISSYLSGVAICFRVTADSVAFDWVNEVPLLLPLGVFLTAQWSIDQFQEKQRMIDEQQRAEEEK